MTSKFDGSSLSLQCKDRGGEGPKKVVCKDTELILKKTYDILSAVKIEGGGGPRSYLYIVKIANFRQTLMLSLISLIWKSE